MWHTEDAAELSLAPWMGWEERLGALAEAGEAVFGSSWPPGRAGGNLGRPCSVDIGSKSLGVEQLEGF